MNKEAELSGKLHTYRYLKEELIKVRIEIQNLVNQLAQEESPYNEGERVYLPDHYLGRKGDLFHILSLRGQIDEESGHRVTVYRLAKVLKDGRIGKNDFEEFGYKYFRKAYPPFNKN